MLLAEQTAVSNGLHLDERPLGEDALVMVRKPSANSLVSMVLPASLGFIDKSIA